MTIDSNPGGGGGDRGDRGDRNGAAAGGGSHPTSKQTGIVGTREANVVDEETEEELARHLLLLRLSSSYVPRSRLTRPFQFSSQYDGNCEARQLVPRRLSDHEWSSKITTTYLITSATVKMMQRRNSPYHPMSGTLIYLSPLWGNINGYRQSSWVLVPPTWRSKTHEAIGNGRE
jgi:hypothetical protein